MAVDAAKAPLNMDSPVTALKGVGRVRAEQLAALGIHTLKELLFYFPRSYEDRTHMATLGELEVGVPACFYAEVATVSKTAYIRKGLSMSRCTLTDGEVTLKAAWFNQPWITDRLLPGRRFCFYGTRSADEKRYDILNPVMEDPDSPPSQTRCIIPVYPLTAGLSSKMLGSLITQALEALSAPGSDAITETLPQSVLAGCSDRLLPLPEACREVHHPTESGRLQRARDRMVFEEFFRFSLGLGLMKERRSRISNYPCSEPCPQRFFDALPFALTGAQRRTLDEISHDLCSGSPMNRLVQGDVGSGKTMVALGAMLQAVANGYQAALMAPTELLAAQHYATISKFTEPLGISCVLLTGSMRTAQRRRTEDHIAVGAAKIIIGTHALFTGRIDFYHLGLVVIDEQHRFGVAQRAALAAKGNTPHMLVLSATPIPRTLALILYGDLDISIIDELPPGRQKIDTFLVDERYRQRLNGFIRQQAQEGHQVYVVCPAVEENQETEITSAEATAKALAAALPELKVGLVHGRLRSEAKDYAMQSFAEHKTDVLVATTVIEVGVDVPNATLMVIENADRFGLSQLHQLRGRVGRGGNKSWCILVSDNRNQETRKRLKTLCSTNDGFEISRQDLALRGPGDFFGQRQSGLPVFGVASLANDLGTLQLAQQAAKDFLEREPDRTDPLTGRLFADVAAMFAAADDTFN